jgi:hypothetical protein
MVEDNQMRGRLWCGLVCLLLLAEASAQGAEPREDKAHSRDPLKDIRQFELVIEDLSKYARECGITEDSIRGAFMYPASSAKFSLGTALETPTIYIRVSTIHLPQGICETEVEMDVQGYQKISLPSSGRDVLATIILWHSGSMTMSYPAIHGRQVKEMIENKTKELITDWNLANE